MNNSVIKVENLSKQYRIGEREGYKTIREAIVNLAKVPFRIWNGTSSKPNHNNSKSKTIWALKDVSFEVKQGEVVGVVGRNGAGKSTLLKILSKITEPTNGRVELKGRVGSLLEVGTGFHPELTGHENIYLYGAILGMDRWEVTRKFDEIVSFAGLEKFIDTPVKRYSSGMYMRLAFAVAAHLETEILLVDEVLAVGDLAFQKKCLGKMGEISQQGRTVLFVSHNMGVVRSLCNNAVLLNNGKKIMKGASSETIKYYMRCFSGTSAEWNAKKDIDRCNNTENLKLIAVRILDLAGEKKSEFSNNEAIFIELKIDIRHWVSNLKVGFELQGEFGDIVFSSFHNDIENIFKKEGFKGGIYCFRAKIPAYLLNSNTYYVSPCAGIHKRRWIFKKEKIVKFSVDFQINNTDYLVNKRPGIIGPFLEWKVNS